MVKYQFVCLLMETSNVNHTALYRDAQTHPGFNSDTFNRLFHTAPGRDKNVTSREHDEVISMSTKALGFKCQFLVNRFNVRHVAIYIRSSTDEVEQSKIVLSEFNRKYQRRVAEPTIVVVNNINTISI